MPFFFFLLPLSLPLKNRPFTCAAVADQHELERGDALRSHLAGESLRNLERERGDRGERERGEVVSGGPNSIANGLEGDDDERRATEEAERANGRRFRGHPRASSSPREAAQLGRQAQHTTNAPWLLEKREKGSLCKGKKKNKKKQTVKKGNDALC